MHSLPELELHSKHGQQGFNGRHWFGARELSLRLLLSKSSQSTRFGPFPGGHITGAVLLSEDWALPKMQLPLLCWLLQGSLVLATQGRVLLLLQSPFPVHCPVQIPSHQVKYSPGVFGVFFCFKADCGWKVLDKPSETAFLKAAPLC